MSDEQQTERDADGMADAVAATAVITMIVVIAAYWLSGMPG